MFKTEAKNFDYAGVFGINAGISDFYSENDAEIFTNALAALNNNNNTSKPVDKKSIREVQDSFVYIRRKIFKIATDLAIFEMLQSGFFERGVPSPIGQFCKNEMLMQRSPKGTSSSEDKNVQEEMKKKNAEKKEFGVRFQFLVQALRRLKENEKYKNNNI